MPDRWRLLAVLVSVLALAGGMTGCGRHSAGSDNTDAGRPQAPIASTENVSESSAPLPMSPSVLRIPDIGVSTPLVSLGLNPDETVEVPKDPDRAGWYRLGPKPGMPGSAVILGHVDSSRGPAVFSRLKTLTPGVRIEVVRADGSVAWFAVRTIATYANDKFPAATVYRNQGRPVLTLVTCGGVYDKSRGGYQANVVVVAAYVGSRG